MIDWTLQYCWTNGWNCVWRGHSVYRNRPLIPQFGRCISDMGALPPGVKGSKQGANLQCPPACAQSLEISFTAHSSAHTERGTNVRCAWCARYLVPFYECTVFSFSHHGSPPPPPL